jgi:hypothetical protein
MICCCGFVLVAAELGEAGRGAIVGSVVAYFGELLIFVDLLYLD